MGQIQKLVRKIWTKFPRREQIRVNLNPLIFLKSKQICWTSTENYIYLRIHLVEVLINL